MSHFTKKFEFGGIIMTKKFNNDEILQIVATMTPDQMALYHQAANAVDGRGIDLANALNDACVDLNTLVGLITALGDELDDIGEGATACKRTLTQDNMALLTMSAMRGSDIWDALLRTMRQLVSDRVNSIEEVLG